jgi:multidrug efflux system membrane fusion protein
MKMMMTQPPHTALRACGVMLACLFLVGCKPAVQAPVAAPAKVTVAKPIQQSVRSYELFDGNVSALLSVDLVARVPGYLTKIEFADGALVKKDQLLFVIEQDQYVQQVNLTNAVFAEAKIEINRQKALLKDNATSQASVDKANSAYLQAEANAKLAQLNLGYTEVRAPFDGLMGRHLIDIGNYLGSSPQGVKLATIQKINPIYVYFSINERDLLKFKSTVGSADQRKSMVNKLPVAVALQGEEGYPHAGVLDFAANLLNTSTGSLQLRAELPNDRVNLLPGLYAKVKVEYGEPRDVILVPNATIQSDQQGDYVYLIDDANKAERRNVKRGQRFSHLIEITSGIKSSDTIIVNGFINVKPGQVVSAETTTLKPHSR